MNSPSTGDTTNQLLDKFRDENALTWLEVATKLGISETYLHRVRKGGQKFSRKLVAKLNQLLSMPDASKINEPRDEDYLSTPIGSHIVWLEDQLNVSRANEARLLQIVETLATLIGGPKPDASGRTGADAPAASHASGALYKTHRSKPA